MQLNGVRANGLMQSRRSRNHSKKHFPKNFTHRHSGYTEENELWSKCNRFALSDSLSPLFLSLSQQSLFLWTYGQIQSIDIVRIPNSIWDQDRSQRCHFYLSHTHTLYLSLSLSLIHSHTHNSLSISLPPADLTSFPLYIWYLPCKNTIVISLRWYSTFNSSQQKRVLWPKKTATVIFSPYLFTLLFNC